MALLSLLARLTLLLLLAATLAGLTGLPILVVLDVLLSASVDRRLIWQASEVICSFALQGDSIGSQVLVARDQLVLVDLAVSRDVDCARESRAGCRS